jgi:hypothetical protein
MSLTLKFYTQMKYDKNNMYNFFQVFPCIQNTFPHS